MSVEHSQPTLRTAEVDTRESLGGQMRNRLGTAGVVSGVALAIGLVSPLMIPGAGGTSTDKDFSDFYTSSGRRSAALLLYAALVIGCWLTVWFFGELRTGLGATSRADLAVRLAAVGAATVMAGGAIDLGPAGVQANSAGPANSEFVGVPIAHALTQAGLLTAVAGLFTFAVAVLLVGLELRRSATFPNWLGVLSVVIAVLLIGSYVLLPAFLLPIWAIIVGIVGARRARPQLEAPAGAARA